MTFFYGTVKRQDRNWEIFCEPQVRARLKRVFPRAPQHAATTLPLLATPENSRELRWFMSRYPLEMSQQDALALNELADRHEDREQSLAELLAGRIELPAFELAKPPRDYQRLPAAAAEISGGLLLADVLGLGKTVSAMCPMTKPANLPAVIVYPAYLPNHWPEKLAEFAPNLRVHHVRTSKPYLLIKQPRQRIADLWDTLPDVILVSYHKLRGWAEVLGEIVQYVVFEECQQLRNDGSDIYRACKYISLAAKQRMGLSATPIYGYGSEFYHVVDVLVPGALGSYDEFVREWCISSPGEKAQLKDPDAFGAYLRREGIMLRRSRPEVGRELPQVQKVPHEIDLDFDVMASVESDAISLARTIVARNEKFRGEKMQASGEFDRLIRQATGVAKAPHVAQFVRMLVETGEQVVLFGWHRAVYDIWMEQLAEFNPVMYTGSESPKQKAYAKEEFVSGRSKVIILSLRSGAGLDGLQDAASIAVFGELDWSPGVHDQGIGRVDRDRSDGLLNYVVAYFVTCSQGADPAMMEVLGVKKEQIEGVINPDNQMIQPRDMEGRQLADVARKFLASRGMVEGHARQAMPEAQAA